MQADFQNQHFSSNFLYSNLLSVGPTLQNFYFVWETWFQKGIRAQISAGDQK